MKFLGLFEMAYQIDKDVPIPRQSLPEPEPGRQYGLLDTLRQMEIGDSFKLPTLTLTNRTGIYNMARNLGIEVLVSLQHQRVWRIK